MSDFTILVKNLPKDSEFGDREDILKAYLWSHFQKIMRMDDEPDGEVRISHEVPRCYEIADITFGK